MGEVQEVTIRGIVLFGISRISVWMNTMMYENVSYEKHGHGSHTILQ